MVDAEKRVGELEDENKQLRKDFSDMKRELDKLRKEVSLFCMSAAWKNAHVGTYLAHRKVVCSSLAVGTCLSNG